VNRLDGVSEWNPLPDVADPIDELVIDDLDLIAELTHPTRSALIHRLRTPHSAAELAERLGVPVTRLYHHLNRLEELGMITVVATRRSGSKTERRYRNVAKGYRVEPSVARDRSPEAVGTVIGALFDIAKHDMQRELALGTLDPASLEDDAAFALLSLSLRPEQHATFVQRLHAVIEEFTAMDAGNELDPHTHRVRLLLAGFPITE
jgi:DNA-binding transcriptional ArsR family regulator